MNIRKLNEEIEKYVYLCEANAISVDSSIMNILNEIKSIQVEYNKLTKRFFELKKENRLIGLKFKEGKISLEDKKEKIKNNNIELNEKIEAINDYVDKVNELNEKIYNEVDNKEYISNILIQDINSIVNKLKKEFKKHNTHLLDLSLTDDNKLTISIYTSFPFMKFSTSTTKIKLTNYIMSLEKRYINFKLLSNLINIDANKAKDIHWDLSISTDFSLVCQIAIHIK